MSFLLIFLGLISGILRLTSHSIHLILNAIRSQVIYRIKGSIQSFAIGSPESITYDTPLKPVGKGSTSIISRLRPGVVVKSPRCSWERFDISEASDFVKDIKHSFSVEEKILNILGEHPRIVRYLGPSENPYGLLFSEASDCDLQTFIDQHNDSIDQCMRLQWCSQAAESVQYIHQKGVIHSDLRPENFLLHINSINKLSLLLCDFGGSTSDTVDGGHLPDSGFFNPRKPWVSTKATDIFSLGSVFYTIMTGHWPYRSLGPFRSVKEKMAYEDMVDDLFASGRFPDVDNLVGGSVIQGCWVERYCEMGALIHDQDLCFKEWLGTH